MSDPYLEVIERNWKLIFALYKELEMKRPIILFDIQEENIYAYPYDGFKAELDEETQVLLEKQYEEALANNYIIVFIRDSEIGKLVSYSLAYEEWIPDHL